MRKGDACLLYRSRLDALTHDQVAVVFIEKQPGSHIHHPHR